MTLFARGSRKLYNEEEEEEEEKEKLSEEERLCLSHLRRETLREERRRIQIVASLAMQSARNVEEMQKKRLMAINKSDK